MNFKEFWKNNKDRYLKLAETDIKLALNTVAEEAWEIALTECLLLSFLVKKQGTTEAARALGRNRSGS